MNTTAAMTFISIGQAFSCWIDSVANLSASLLSRFASPRTIRLVEDENGEFVIQPNQGVAGANFTYDRARMIGAHIDESNLATLATTLAGSHVELVLQPNRFLFRPLELPKRATEFMPGVVRSQIDRLTPWDAADAAFGWSQPTPADADKMIVTIAVTTIALIKPYVEAVVDIGAHSIAVFTGPPETDSGASSIKVWEQSGRGVRDIARIRRALLRVLAAAGITTGIALGANAIVATSLTAQQDELAHQISAARSAAGAARASATGSMARSERAVEQRKHDAPSTVLILETLSKILPDQTYVTELRLEGNKVRLTGITRDAPSLIGLIEQSGRFTRAAFFAPTTRSPSVTGDRFHIEAVIKAFGPSA